MRQVKKVLSFHFEEGRSGRFIARHCAMARRSVAQTLTRFAASGLSWPQARDLDDEALEAALYPPKQDVSGSDVDWAQVEKDLAGRGMTLFVLWEEWRDTNPDAMSYPTWCRRFRQARSRQDVTMRQNRSPGERLFVDYAGMTVPLLTADGKKHTAQVFVATMGVSGRLYVEATLTQKVEDWCASHVRCFEDMGYIPHIVVIDDVPGNIIDDHACCDTAVVLQRGAVRPGPRCQGLIGHRDREDQAGTRQQGDQDLDHPLAVTGLQRQRLSGEVRHHPAARLVVEPHLRFLPGPRDMLLEQLEKAAA